MFYKFMFYMFITLRQGYLFGYAINYGKTCLISAYSLTKNNRLEIFFKTNCLLFLNNVVGSEKRSIDCELLSGFAVSISRLLHALIVCCHLPPPSKSESGTKKKKTFYCRMSCRLYSFRSSRSPVGLCDKKEASGKGLKHTFFSFLEAPCVNGLRFLLLLRVFIKNCSSRRIV